MLKCFAVLAPFIYSILYLYMQDFCSADIIFRASCTFSFDVAILLLYRSGTTPIARLFGFKDFMPPFTSVLTIPIMVSIALIVASDVIGYVKIYIIIFAYMVGFIAHAIVTLAMLFTARLCRINGSDEVEPNVIHRQQEGDAKHKDKRK